MLRYHDISGINRFKEFVMLTGDKIAAGGIHDHIGGGFARYSTDQKWLVPHFEKMLYDNALLGTALCRAISDYWQGKIPARSTEQS